MTYNLLYITISRLTDKKIFYLLTGIIYIAICIFCFSGCIKEEMYASSDNNLKVNVEITSDAADSYIYQGDAKFSSIALFIFDKKSGECIYNIFQDSFNNPAYKDSCHIMVQLKPREKIFYAIANYKDGGTFSKQLREINTQNELDNLLLISSEINDNQIVMAVKKEIQLTELMRKVTLEMERLTARVDVHIFKSEELREETVILKSVTLHNQILNTTCFTTDMPLTPLTANPVKSNSNIIPQQTTISQDLHPSDAQAVFYSYQNIILPPPSNPEANPDITPYLEIILTIGSNDYTYTAFITDENQHNNKYSLLRNTVYIVTALLQGKDNLEIKAQVLPWNVQPSYVGYAPEYYLFDAWDGTNKEALAGEIQWPRASQLPGALPGDTENETSYASYSFELTAPAGAVWTATLTNGLEFAFSQEGSISGQKAVSKGIARTSGAYEIKVGATKAWNGIERKTELYITVDGEELEINPIVGTERKFTGSSTRILIRQTEYHSSTGN